MLKGCILEKPENYKQLINVLQSILLWQSI